MTHVPMTRAIPVKDVNTALFRATMRMNVPLTPATPPLAVRMYPLCVMIVICVPMTPVRLARVVRTPRSVATITTRAHTIIAQLPQGVPMSHLRLRIATIKMPVPEITAILVPDVTTQI